MVTSIKCPVCPKRTPDPWPCPICRRLNAPNSTLSPQRSWAKLRLKTGFEMVFSKQNGSLPDESQSPMRHFHKLERFPVS